MPRERTVHSPKTRQSRALFNGTGASCPSPDRGSLQSFGGHVPLDSVFGSLRPRVRLTIITCSWHRAGRCNRLSSVFADAHYERIVSADRDIQEIAGFQNRDPATKTSEPDLEYQSQSHAEIRAIQFRK